jgi:hypothetical protein
VSLGDETDIVIGASEMDPISFAGTRTEKPYSPLRAFYLDEMGKHGHSSEVLITKSNLQRKMNYLLPPRFSPTSASYVPDGHHGWDYQGRTSMACKVMFSLCEY